VVVSADLMRVPILRLPHYPAEWELPRHATEGSAAVDLRNAGPAVTIPPLGRRLLPTGLALALPPDTEAQIRPRSGLAFRRGVTVVNTPATIDSDYRGEILVPLVNLDPEAQQIEHGERMAQLLVCRVPRLVWEEVRQLPPSGRGTGGFGSTGR
jgi:dUTP pyrophosphatase